jgi:putative phage-type endonuclease
MIQGTEEWFEARRGKITGSNVGALLVNGKGEAGFGTDALKYMRKLIAERITGKVEESYSSPAMERGSMLEGEARDKYMFNTLRYVDEEGFVEYNEYFGSSPDGICDDRIIEIKCLQYCAFIDAVMNDSYSNGYDIQCQCNMLATGKEMADLVFYHPDMGMRIKTIKEDKELQAKILKRVKDFNDLIESKIEIVKANLV